MLKPIHTSYPVASAYYQQGLNHIIHIQLVKSDFSRTSSYIIISAHHGPGSSGNFEQNASTTFSNLEVVAVGLVALADR